MKLYTTTHNEDPRQARSQFAALERLGYDGVFSFEARHDPFIALAAAAADTRRISLGTAIAVAFARNPMNLAHIGNDLQLLSEGRFILGLGSQIKPHIENRFSSVWSHPSQRMREMVLALRAIWRAWETGEPLRFEGEFYRHTLMTPAFDPGPNPFGPPPIYLGGFGAAMVAVAGEVADGFIAHPFNSRKSLLELTLPALEKGLGRAGRSRDQIQVVCATLIVTADDPEQLKKLKHTARKQLAFYGSTPAYRPTLDCHGWGELHDELNILSKQGHWDAMAELISDEILATLAVVGTRGEIATLLRQRLGDIADGVSLTNNRAPDAGHWADIVAELKTAAPL